MERKEAVVNVSQLLQMMGLFFVVMYEFNDFWSY